MDWFYIWEGDISELSVRLLGQFQVKSSGETITFFSSDKVRALLSYLVTEVHRPHRREILATLLWPEKPEDAARGNLRQALSNLRTIIKDEQATPPFLLVTRQTIQWNPDGQAQVDILNFSTTAKGISADSNNIEDLKRIANLYEGEFLEGFSLPESIAFHEWALQKREHFARQAYNLICIIANYYEEKRSYPEAIPFAWRLVELNPWDEAGQRQLMRLLAFTGQRGASLAQYEKLSLDLEESLDVPPEKATSDLFEVIKANRLDSVLTSAVPITRSMPSFLEIDARAVAQQEEHFVGRQDELERMASHLERMLAGQGQVVFVTGEAGIGKTALMREFSRRAQAENANLLVVSGNCNAFTGLGDPYLPFCEILDGLTGNVEAAWRAGVVSHAQALKLWETLPYSAHHIAESASDLLDTFISGEAVLKRLTQFAGEWEAWMDSFSTLVKQKKENAKNIPMQVNLFSQYTLVLQLLSRQAPLVLILDDLQWADMGTISLLFHLSKQLPGYRIMLIGAYRPGDVLLQVDGYQHKLLSLVHELQRDCGDIVIDLDKDPSKAFIDSLLDQEPNKFDSTFRETLFHLTDSNPLFTVELLEGLRVRGDVHKNLKGEWIASPDLHWDVLPPRVEGIISERIGRLPQHLRYILLVASVEGEFFTAEVVAGVMDTPAPDILTRLSSQLDKQHGLVRARRIEWVDGQQFSVYQFRHSLFQKFVYSQLDESERVKLHAQVGNVLVSLIGEKKDLHAAQLARHFRLSVQSGKAIEYYRMAGERARMLSANNEAIEHYNTALSLLVEIPESQKRDLSEIVLQLGLGTALQALQGFGASVVGDAYNRAWELCQRVGDTPLIYDALGLIFSFFNFQYAFDKSSEALNIIRTMAITQNDQMRILQSHWGYGYLDYLRGDFSNGLDHFEKALEIFDPENHISLGRMMGMDPGTYCYGWAAYLAAQVGYLDRSSGYLQIAQDWAEKSTNRLDMALILTLRVWLSDTFGEVQAHKKYAEDLMQLSTQHSFYFYQAYGQLGTGLHMALHGDPRAGIETIQSGLSIMNMIGTQDHQFFVHLARAFLAAGLIQDGLDSVEKAEKMMRDTGAGTLKVECYTTKGKLFQAQGRSADAEDCILSAIKLSQEKSARLFELRASLELARLWQTQNRVDEARAALTPICDWFPGGMEITILHEARELLNSLA